MESASFQPQPPQQLRASKSWLGGLGGAVLQPPKRRGRCVRTGGRPWGWFGRSTAASALPLDPARASFPQVYPLWFSQDLVSARGRPLPCCFLHPGVLGHPRTPLGSRAAGPPTTQPQDAPAALRFSEPHPSEPLVVPRVSGDLAGLCQASPSLIRAPNRADEGCRRVGGHRQRPPCWLSILGGAGPARFPRPPHHLWRAN